MMRKIGEVAGNGSPAVVPTPRRMTIDSIREAEQTKAERVVLYGPEGIGKTWWANQWENPVFLAVEDGLKGIEPKPQAFPEPQNWQDILDAIDILRLESHDFKTLVIDTADWVEALCQTYLLKRDNETSIEGYGYGKGYVLSSEEWRRLISVVNKLHREKSMNIVVLAHSSVQTFSNPLGINYDRFQMKMDKRICALLKEWSDAVLFANYEILVDAKKKQAKGKAYGGDKFIHAFHTPGFDAKNRYGITDPIPMEFKAFWKYVEGGKTDETKSAA